MAKTLTTKVINIRNQRHIAEEIYIGRAGHGADGYFGNPVRMNQPCPICHETHTERGTTLICFETYLRERLRLDTEFKNNFMELYGATLVCFCKPKACHGDIIARILEEMHDPNHLFNPDNVNTSVTEYSDAD
jgi:hypothetical protein